VREASRWDGIRYVSRQNNTVFCYVIFERSGLVKDMVAGPLVEQLCGDSRVSAI
jgi:hypothetical protein